jgi:hypothetical protein
MAVMSPVSLAALVSQFVTENCRRWQVIEARDVSSKLEMDGDLRSYSILDDKLVFLGSHKPLEMTLFAADPEFFQKLKANLGRIQIIHELYTTRNREGSNGIYVMRSKNV